MNSAAKMLHLNSRNYLLLSQPTFIISRDRKDPVSLFNVTLQSALSTHSALLPKRTWYDSFIIPLIISTFIYLSDRVRPPPLRCLIGVHRSEVQPASCQTQRTDLSGPRTAASENEQPASDPYRLQKQKPSSLVKHSAVVSGPVYRVSLWWRLLGTADKVERAFIIICPFSGSYFTIWITLLCSNWELLNSKMRVWW